MRKQHNYWVYIMTNPRKTTLYIGVTNNLTRRIQEHVAAVREKKKTFTGRYHLCHLVYFEWHKYINNAIYREKELKNLLRSKKEALIETINPEWKFLEGDFLPPME